MKGNGVGIFNPSWVNFVEWELKTLVIGMMFVIKAGRYFYWVGTQGTFGTIRR